MHGTAVTLASRHDEAARQLHKALDRRHKLAVNQFDKAATQDDLRAMWRNAIRRGDIPGAYWATLTHPLANQMIIREAFGEVHMLSHLVGSANRADIRRLCQLEAANAELEAKLERQQQALHTAVVTRDARIQELRDALTSRIITDLVVPQNESALNGIIIDLERRLAAQNRRRSTIEERLSAARHDLHAERAARLTAERNHRAVQAELEAIELFVFAAAYPHFPGRSAGWCRAALCRWQTEPDRPYARPGRAIWSHLLASRWRGGKPPNLLAGLASRSDLVLFPVDCISHDAANIVKSLCRRAGKRFIPLRSASVTSLLTALHALSQTSGSHPKRAVQVFLYRS